MRSLYPVFTWALIGALVPHLAFGAACPVDSTGSSVYPNWPTTQSPTGSGINTAGMQCGGASSYLYQSGRGGDPGYGSAAAARSAGIAAGKAYHSALSSGGWTISDSYVGIAAGKVQLCVRMQQSYVNTSFIVEVPVVSPAAACTPPPPPCGDGTMGEVVTGRATDFTAFVNAWGQCVDSCKVASITPQGPGINKDAAGTFFYSGWLKYTGESCTTPPGTPASPAGNAAAKPSTENCVTSSKGVSYCSSDAYGENCGYVNNKFVCLGKTDKDECWVNDDGSRICAEGAPTPPVPDSGTRGVKATPTDTVKAKGKDGTENVYNYYNTTVVSGSAAPAGTSGANPNRTDSTNPSTAATPVAIQGDGTGTGEGGSDESAGGGADCSAPPTCSGDAIDCAVLVQTWRTMCNPSPSDADLEAATGLTTVADPNSIFGEATEVDVSTAFDTSSPYGGGACPPDRVVNILGSAITIEFSKFCALLQAVGYLVMVAAVMVSSKIVIGAPVKV